MTSWDWSVQARESAVVFVLVLQHGKFWHKIVVVVVALLHVSRAHFNMMCRAMMLCKIICLISGSRLPMDSKFLFVYAIAEPVIAHINGFRSFLFEGTIHDAVGACIICLEMGWRL